MRIGLLECDHVREPLRPIAGDYVDMFTAMVADADPAAKVVPYDVRHGVWPARPDECDAWLCTGSSSSVYDDDPWIAELAGFVRQVQAAGVPFVGICFGHQLLAHALGGRTERAAVGWGAGALPLRVVAPASWMDPPTSELTLLHSHQDQVTVLPPGGAILGEAPHCPVAVLTVGPRMLGVQAHPEFGAEYLRALIESRVDRLTPQGVARARESLDRPTDGPTVAQWILAFMRQGQDSSG